MGTKQTTDTTNKYDPTSLGTMQTMLGPGTGSGGGFGGGFNPSGGSSSIGGFQHPGMFPRGSAMGAPGQAAQQAGGLGNVTANYINNPFSNPFFSTQQQLGTSQAGQLGGMQMSNLLRNQTASGMAGGASSPAALEMQ